MCLGSKTQNSSAKGRKKRKSGYYLHKWWPTFSTFVAQSYPASELARAFLPSSSGPWSCSANPRSRPSAALTSCRFYHTYIAREKESRSVNNIWIQSKIIWFSQRRGGVCGKLKPCDQIPFDGGRELFVRVFPVDNEPRHELAEERSGNGSSDDSNAIIREHHILRPLGPFASTSKPPLVRAFFTATSWLSFSLPLPLSLYLFSKKRKTDLEPVLSVYGDWIRNLISLISCCLDRPSRRDSFSRAFFVVWQISASVLAFSFHPKPQGKKERK